MTPLTIVSAGADAGHASRELARAFAVRVLALDEVANQRPDGLVLVDVRLDDPARADQLRRWLARRPAPGTTIFAVDKASRIQTVQAYSLGASDVVYRPLCPSTVVQKLLKSKKAVAGDDGARLLRSCGVVAGITALQKLFATAAHGAPLEPDLLVDAGETLVDHIQAYGFGDWVKAIRVHHDQTYQHCLLVAGAAAAFAQHLGFSSTDRRRVAVAGLLHDAGKAMVPVELLEAPRPLDQKETTIVRQHPELGHGALQATQGLHPEMLDVVLHHHEYLDGSGYPHGLGGKEISDLTRIVTIADVFGALIEHRAYRPPMSGRAAFEILQDMGGRLDRHLVNGFRPLSHVQFARG